MNLLSFLADVTLRSSLVLGFVFILLFLLRRASAAERHFILLLGLALVAVIPAGIILSPKIPLVIKWPGSETSNLMSSTKVMAPLETSPNTQPTISSVVTHNPAAISPAIMLADGLGVLLTMGALTQVVVLGQVAWSWRKVRRFAAKASLNGGAFAQAQVFAGAKGIPPVLVSDEIKVPVLVGWLHPVIILPRNTLHASERCLSMVLCHEIAHFRRGDSFLLPLHWFLRIIYWWHPLIWLSLARLRRERENACDDLVLHQNFRATDYADLIVNTAREMRADQPLPMGILAMASSSSVGQRVTSILNPRVRRKQTGRWSMTLGCLMTLGLSWPLVATQIQAKDQSESSDATTPANPSLPQSEAIEMDFHLISINEKVYIEKRDKIDAAVAKADLAFFKNLPGASVLASPGMSTPDGSKGEISIIKPLTYPSKFDIDKKTGRLIPSDFHTEDIGPSIEARPILQADKKSVKLTFKCELTSFEGWGGVTSEVRKPVLHSVSITGEKIIDQHGLALWVGEGAIQMPYGDNWDSDNGASPMRILLFIEAHPLPHVAKTIPNNLAKMVKIRLKYFQISEKTYLQQPAAINEALGRGDISFFKQFPDFDLLTQQSILQKFDESATVETLEIDKYPVKLSRDSNGQFIPSNTTVKHERGIASTVSSSLSSNGIALKYADVITACTGVIANGPDEEYPSFSDSKYNQSLVLAPGKPLGLWTRTNFQDLSKMWAKDILNIHSQDTPRVRIGMMITAELCSNVNGPSTPAH